MENFFDANYQGPAFALFDSGHLAFLSVIGLTALAFFYFRNAWDAAARRKLRWGLAIAIILAELAWQGWSLYYGKWSIQTNLPLHLCSVFVWLSAYMLIRRSYVVYELAYFLGIGGAMQALLTPDAGIYGLPHFRAIQTLVGHGLIFLAPIYMTAVEGFRPTLGSFKRVILWTNIYMVFVFGVNLLLGSNYLFIAHKPEFPSLIDLLWPWPWYIIQLEVIGLAIVSLLYIPFGIKDWRARASALPEMSD
jgi:hypothetical integral membrane protein (TIGR02206 family)